MPSRENDEYELVPLSPIRRIEKRLDKIENTSSGFDIHEFFRELVAIIRMNQEIVDELAKANDALRIELARLPSRLEDVTKNMNELISYIKAAAIEETTKAAPENLRPLTDKMDTLIEINRKLAEENEAMISYLESIEKKLKPALPPRPPMLRPLVR